MFETPRSEALRTDKHKLEDYDLGDATFTVNSDGTLLSDSHQSNLMS